ncbi:hypothetical protein LINPERPRIM_LOCUS8446 [Linum perenne]
MRRATFFTSGSQKRSGDLAGFTFLMQLWALESILEIVERYTERGAPPMDDSRPQGMRWIPSIVGHHRVIPLAEL